MSFDSAKILLAIDMVKYRLSPDWVIQKYIMPEHTVEVRGEHSADSCQACHWVKGDFSQCAVNIDSWILSTLFDENSGFMTLYGIKVDVKNGMIVVTDKNKVDHELLSWLNAPGLIEKIL